MLQEQAIVKKQTKVSEALYSLDNLERRICLLQSLVEEVKVGSTIEAVKGVEVAGTSTIPLEKFLNELPGFLSTFADRIEESVCQLRQALI